MPRFALTNYFVLLIIIGCLILIIIDRTGLFPFLRLVTTTLYGWVLLLGGFALLLGVVNVLLVHVQRIQSGQAGWTHSLVLVATLCAVFVAGLLDGNGTHSQMVEWIFDSLIAPGQAMLAMDGGRITEATCLTCGNDEPIMFNLGEEAGPDDD